MATALDKIVSKVLYNKDFYYIYPSIVLLGIIARAFCSEAKLATFKATSYYISSKNDINQVFAYKGNLIFSVLFFGLFIAQVINSLPKDLNLDRVKALVLTQFKPYFVKYVIKIVSLHFIFFLIDLLFVHTGGQCTVEPVVADSLGAKCKSLAECMSYNGTWVNLKEGFCLVSSEQLIEVITSAEVCRVYGKWEGGFDVSGHFCFLTTLSLILWNELALFHRVNIHEYKFLYSDDDTVDDWSTVDVVNLWKWFILATLAIWAFILTVTSVFYHTYEEIAMGLVMGHFTPFIIYFLIPNIPQLHKHLIS